MAKIINNTINQHNSESELTPLKKMLITDDDDHESHRLDEIDQDEQEINDYFEN